MEINKYPFITLLIKKEEGRYELEATFDVGGQIHGIIHKCSENELNTKIPIVFREAEKIRIKKNKL